MIYRRQDLQIYSINKHAISINKLTRTNCSRKVYEIEPWPWQRWRGWQWWEGWGGDRGWRGRPIAQGKISRSVAFPTHVWKMPNICNNIIILSTFCERTTDPKCKTKHDALQNTHIVRSIFRAHLILRPDYFVGARCDFQIRLVRMY